MVALLSLQSPAQTSTPSPSASAQQPVASREQAAVQPSTPPPYPRLWQLWPPRSDPSHASPVSRIPLPQKGAPPVSQASPIPSLSASSCPGLKTVGQLSIPS